MSNVIIRAALETRLFNWASSQTPPIPISFENVSFTKPADGSPFLECFLIPNVTINRQVVGTQKTLLGMFQVNCWAKQGIGMNTAEQLAENIVELFPIIPKTGSVSIERTPTVDRSLKDPASWIVCPVLIKYRYEA